MKLFRLSSRVQLRNRLRTRVTSGEEAEQLRALYRGLDAFEALHGPFVYKGQDLRVALRQMNLTPPTATPAAKEIFEMDEGGVRFACPRSSSRCGSGGASAVTAPLSVFVPLPLRPRILR